MIKEGLAVAFMVLFLGVVCASFSVGNVSHELTSEYAPSGNVSGWINISFTNEPLDSLFTDSFDNEVALRTLLRANPAYAKTCNTINCTDDFSIEGNALSGAVSFNANETKQFGFVLSGKITEIESFSLGLTSDAASSCTNQLAVDLFSDGVYDFMNARATASVCATSAKNYSCFEPTSPTQPSWVDDTPYCQNVFFDAAAGFRVGVWLKKTGSISPDVKILLFHDGVSLDTECELTDFITSTGQEISCDLDYAVQEPDTYTLCLFANTKEEIYQTERNTNPSTLCGYYGTPTPAGRTPTTAYHLFSQPLTYDAFGSTTFNDTTGELTSEIETYLVSRYGGLDCSGECIVPLSVYTHDAQSVNPDSLRVVYKTTSGKTELNTLYSLNTTAAKVSSSYAKLFLDKGGFQVPDELDNYTFRLSLNDQELFGDEITVGNVPLINAVRPLSAALGYATNFTVEVDALGGAITSYRWNFDGTTTTTTSPHVVHAFSTLGDHTLTLTVLDSNHKSSTKEFLVSVSTPKVQIARDLDRLERAIASLEEELILYHGFEREALEQTLLLNVSKQLVEESRVLSENATTQEDYLKILSLLSQVHLPDTITLTDAAESVLFFPLQSVIYGDVIAQLSDEPYDYAMDNDYAKAVLLWNQQHRETTISFKQISAIEGTVQLPLVQIFTLESSAKENTDEAYLFIKKMDALTFAAGTTVEDVGDFYRIALGSTNTVSFYTSEAIAFTELPAFIAPHLEVLNSFIDEAGCANDADCAQGSVCSEAGRCIQESASRWTIFALAMILLLIIATIVYIIMVQWYKNKYETYLFKNRNNLFNLITYITTQKRKGVSDDELEKRLKKAHWKGEQITYALKKFHGQNTGMWELPFLKLFGKESTKLSFPPKTLPPSRALPFGGNPFYGSKP